MLDIHILRSPQIYHNNPSILESEYRSTSTQKSVQKETEMEFKDPKKIMASHIYMYKICNKNIPRGSVTASNITRHASAFERNKLFKVEILKENYTFK